MPPKTHSEITEIMFRHHSNIVAANIAALEQIARAGATVQDHEILREVGHMFEVIGRRVVLNLPVMGKDGLINSETLTKVVARTVPFGLGGIELFLEVLKVDIEKLIRILDQFPSDYRHVPSPDDFNLVQETLNMRAIIGFRQIGIEAMAGAQAVQSATSVELREAVERFDSEIRTEARMAALIAFNVVRKPYLDLVPPGQYRDRFWFVTEDADLDPNHLPMLEQLLVERLTARRIIKETRDKLEAGD